MKKIIRIVACFAILLFLMIGTQSFINTNPDPVPAPNETYFYFYPNEWWQPADSTWNEYYDLRYSVYGITESPYSNLQEGPYYPDEGDDTNLLAEHYCEYTTNTYATIWGRRTEFHYWTNLGSIHMNSGNVMMVQGSQTYVFKFYIDMDDIPSS